MLHFIFCPLDNDSDLDHEVETSDILESKSYIETIQAYLRVNGKISFFKI